MGCLWLTIAGGVFEVVGLALVAWEIGRVQRQVFGTPIVLARLEAILRRVLPRPLPDVRDEGTVVAAARFEGDQRTVTHVPPATLEELAQRVEQLADELRADIRQEARRCKQSIESVRRLVLELEGDVAGQRDEEAEARKASLRRQVTVQSVGTCLFFVGALLSVLGNAINC